MITLDTEDLDDHQARLLDVLCEEFEEAPLLDATNGPGLYHRLRALLTPAGATDDDFEFLTGQLARLIIESDNPFTPRQKTTQLKLISEMFALRNFHLVVDRGRSREPRLRGPADQALILAVTYLRKCCDVSTRGTGGGREDEASIETNSASPRAEAAPISVKP